MESQSELKQLFEKYLSGRYNREELDFLLSYFQLPDHSHQLHDLILKELEQPVAVDATLSSDVKNIVDNVGRKLHQEIRPVRRVYPYLKIAASVLVFLTAGIIFYLYQSNSSVPHTEMTNKYQNDIPPGSNRATLTFEDGSSIHLSEKHKGVLVGKETSYNDGTPIHTTPSKRATLRTPRGGQYQLTLPDGTLVWLNASSTISYPSEFDKARRDIEVTGEVLLEVAKDADRPFVVHVAGQQLEVLGTRFNVNAYGDHAKIITTLCEGSLRITDQEAGYSTILKPGQQLVKSDEGIDKKQVDIDEVVSWRDGMYILNNQTIQYYATHIERWYDVTMELKGKGETRFSAIIPRDARLSAVLDAIELKTGIHFKIEGRRVVVED